MNVLEIGYDLYMHRLFGLAEKNKTPLAGTFELTSRCCLDCKMCYIHKRENDGIAKSRELSTAKWIELAKNASASGMLLLLLTGGEPLLRQDFDEIYLACKNMGLLVSINTNGVLIDDKKIELLKSSPPQRVNLTLYGMSEETYERLCGNKNAFTKVKDAIKKLKENDIPLRLNYSITPYNKEDFYKALAFSREIDVPLRAVSYMFPPVRSQGESVRLSPEEAAEMHFNYQRTTLGDEKFYKYLTDFNKKRDRLRNVYECEEKISCRAGISSFWVTYDGYMLPCGMMTEPAEMISDFDAAWKEISRKRENILLPKECSVCENRSHCDICAAVSHAETGSFNRVPEYACKKAAHYKSLCVKLSKNNFGI